jgi:Uma2 family endonuclease
MDPARQLLTYDDLLRHDAPDRRVPELMGGELVYKAAPRATHAFTQGALPGELYRFRRGPDGTGWWILVEPDVRLSLHTVLRPDLAGWRTERLERPPAGVVEVVPDWVCEVLSPSNEGYDRGAKRAAYAAHGVGHLWLVSPEARTLEAFVLEQGRWMLLGTWTGGVATVAPFDGEIDVGALFVPGGPELAQEPVAAYR